MSGRFAFQPFAVLRLGTGYADEEMLPIQAVKPDSYQDSFLD